MTFILVDEERNTFACDNDKGKMLMVLPSSSMMVQASLLHIQNHLAMVCDSLWAINSMIILPEMETIYNNSLRSEVLNLPTEFANWANDVATAVADVGELLGRILDWEQASLPHSILGNIQQEHFRRVVLTELKEMLCNLNFLVLRGSTMGLPREPLHSMNPLREDYSNVLKKEVVGREEDVEKLIAIFQQQGQLVSSDDNGSDDNPFVVAIVGRPGIGKTTLAHMIYHHAWLRQQFHHRIWVDVPSYWSFKTIHIIAKEFARSISNEEHWDQKFNLDLPLQVLWEYVSQQLDGSRYFLVLHCEEYVTLKQKEWDDLKNILLRVGGPGKAVLITSDSITASDFREEDIRRYDLNPLSEDAWVELFKRHAATPIPPSKQVMQFFQHFIGEPFSAKILGQFSDNIRVTLLEKIYFIELIDCVSRLATSTFIDVRLNQYSQLLDVDIFDTREVMLHMLTADYLVLADGLASDLFDHPDRIHPEAMSKSWRLSQYVFTKMLYLRMKVPKDYSTTIPSHCRYLCLKINARSRQFRLPTVPVEVSNKLIILILQEDEEIAKEDVEEEITLRVYKKRRMKAATAISKFLDKMLQRLVHLRMLIVETSMIQSLPSEVSKLINLRYLHLSKNKMKLLPDSLFDLLNLRILCLLRCQMLRKIPEQIYKLKKLQILKLAYCTKLQRLPKSITRLRNLVELNVEGCCWLSELSEDYISFKSLRILNIIGCASLSQIPRGIEQSIGLRKLLGIFVGANGGLEFTQLQALTNLQEIELRNLEQAEETQTEVLMSQQRLRNLSLHWGGEEANENSESAATPPRVLEALRPNVHLERLEIISYKGEKFPDWMSKQQLAYLRYLVEIRLINLKRCATLPSLGQLPKLQKLEISGMDLIKHIEETFCGDGDMFPQLKELTFSEMLALEKLSVPERKKVKFFPRLIILTLIQCPKLKYMGPRILDYWYFTMRIWLNNETIWSAEFSNWSNLRRIKRIEIVGCQELRCLPQGMRSLNRLSELTINSCNNLTTLIVLDSLKVLHIYACPVLSFNLEAFTTLSELEIEGCPKMLNYYNAWRGKNKMRNTSGLGAKAVMTI